MRFGGVGFAGGFWGLFLMCLVLKFVLIDFVGFAVYYGLRVCIYLLFALWLRALIGGFTGCFWM